MNDKKKLEKYRIAISILIFVLLGLSSLFMFDLPLWGGIFVIAIGSVVCIILIIILIIFIKLERKIKKTIQ